MEAASLSEKASLLPCNVFQHWGLQNLDQISLFWLALKRKWMQGVQTFSGGYKTNFFPVRFLWFLLDAFPFAKEEDDMRGVRTALPKKTSQESSFEEIIFFGGESKMEAGQSPAKMQKVDAHRENGTAAKEDAPKVIYKNGTKPTPEPFLRIKKLLPDAILPFRGSALAAGYDLSSACVCVVPARGKALVQTGLSIAVPEGTYGRIAPRSGLAWKHSIDVGAGVIDADYRGAVGVILFNHSDHAFEVKPGDRIAQLIIEKIVTPNVLEVDDLDSTFRGAGGFGSTGV